MFFLFVNTFFFNHGLLFRFIKCNLESLYKTLI